MALATSCVGTWIVLALVLLVIFVANLPAFFQYAKTVCTLPDAGYCPAEQLTPAYIQVLDQLHILVAAAEGFLAALCVAVSVLFWLVGLRIFWRKSQEWMGCVRPLFRGDDALLTRRHLAPRPWCRGNSDISPADRSADLPLCAGL